MAVEAVVSVVIQKLTDMLIEEPVVFDKVIDQVEEIRIKLRRMRGFLIDAEENQGRDETVKQWANNYLRVLYEVEDIIETFAVGIARRQSGWRRSNSRIGTFFNNYANPFFFFSNLKACQKLRRKMGRIRIEINDLKKAKPDMVRDASFKYLVSESSFQDEESLSHHHDDQQNSFGHYDQAEQEEEEEITEEQEEEEEEGKEICGRCISRSFCYIDLPVHSKLCLLYMVLFPKEVDIPVRRLLRLWLAEGFVNRSPTMIPEDVAQEYFDDLVSRNMIQISKLRSDGSPRRCRLPGALHDNLLLKTQDISLFHVHQDHHNCACNIKEAGPFGLRRIVEYLDIKNCPLNDSQLQHLRSYISFNLQKKDIPAREVANFVKKMTGGKRGFALLRVLDLEGVYKPSLPDKLGDLLFHLRYLGLRWTFLDNLPPSVGDLPYLETLDLKRTYINTLPNSIWKLKHLRHLNLNEIRLDMPKQPSRILTRLLTLWGLFVDDKSPVKNGLSRLHDLRELGITFNLCSSSSLDLADWISNLTNLQSLRLRSKDERGRPSQLHLKPLPRLGKLSHMNLLGNLHKLPDKHDFPPGLKVLTLSVSRLTQDPMPTLGQLQSLTVLRLLADSYLGERIVCPLRGFPKLGVLKLWMLKNLKEWEVKEGAMQNLKELNIRCCFGLKTLPPTLLQLSTLEKLTLTNMPDRFVAKVEQKKSEHTSLTVTNYDFTALPWEQDNVSDRVQADH